MDGSSRRCSREKKVQREKDRRCRWCTQSLAVRLLIFLLILKCIASLSPDDTSACRHDRAVSTASKSSANPPSASRPLPPAPPPPPLPPRRLRLPLDSGNKLLEWLEEEEPGFPREAGGILVLSVENVEWWRSEELPFGWTAKDRRVA